jgi:uncharacterized RDD family membrane protein YckC
MQIIRSKAMQGANQEDFGGFWRRALAQLIDGVILFIPIAIVEVPLHEWMYGPLGELQEVAFIPQVVAGFGIWAVYEIPFWTSPWQATPGKRLCGMVVTTNDGARLSTSRALLRYLCKFVTGPIIVGVLFVPFTKRRQALHDLLAGTLVPRRGALARLQQT